MGLGEWILRLEDRPPHPILSTIRSFYDIFSASKRSRTVPNEASSQLQRSTLLALTKSPAIDGGQRREAFEEICRAASDGLQAARVSIWSYDAEREAIVCEELYERNEHRHSSGLVLYRKDFPAYFDYIHEQRVLAADDAHTDPATSCFSASYLKIGRAHV